MSYWAGVLIVGVVVGTGMQFVSAWTEPTQAPPGGNVSGPVTVGSEAQTKEGGLVALSMAALKMFSNSTTNEDPGNTLVTKDYVDAQSGGAPGATLIYASSDENGFTEDVFEEVKQAFLDGYIVDSRCRTDQGSHTTGFDGDVTLRFGLVSVKDKRDQYSPAYTLTFADEFAVSIRIIASNGGQVAFSYSTSGSYGHSAPCNLGWSIWKR